MSAALFNATRRGTCLTAYGQNGAVPRAVFDYGAEVFTHGWQVFRSSDAALMNTDGSISMLPADVPRIIGSGAQKHLLLERAAMTLCNPSKTTAVNLTSVTPLGAAGGLERTRIEDDGTGYLQFNAIDIASLAAGAEITCSAIVEAETASSCELWLGIGTTGAARLRYQFSLGDGAVTEIANIDGVPANAGMRALGGNRHRIWITGPLISADTVELTRFTGITGTLTYGAMQVETGTMPSAPILSASGTRAAETLGLDLAAGDYDAILWDKDGAESALPVTITAGALNLPVGKHEITRLCLF